MTWNANLSGHHNTDDWRDEEYELLRSLVDAVEADETLVIGQFGFSGNHVTATSVDEAKEKLAAYDAEGESNASEEGVQQEGH